MESGGGGEHAVLDENFFSDSSFQRSSLLGFQRPEIPSSSSLLPRQSPRLCMGSLFNSLQLFSTQEAMGLGFATEPTKPILALA